MDGTSLSTVNIKSHPGDIRKSTSGTHLVTTRNTNIYKHHIIAVQLKSLMRRQSSVPILLAVTVSSWTTREIEIEGKERSVQKSWTRSHSVSACDYPLIHSMVAYSIDPSWSVRLLRLHNEWPMTQVRNESQSKISYQKLVENIG